MVGTTDGSFVQSWSISIVIAVDVPGVCSSASSHVCLCTYSFVPPALVCVNDMCLCIFQNDRKVLAIAFATLGGTADYIRSADIYSMVQEFIQ